MERIVDAFQDRRGLWFRKLYTGASGHWRGSPKRVYGVNVNMDFGWVIIIVVWPNSSVYFECREKLLGSYGSGYARTIVED